MDRIIRPFILTVLCVTFLAALPAAAQTVDDTQLKQVIIFGRHGVRTPVVKNSLLNNYSATQYPTFPPASPSDPPLDVSVLTPNGATIETLLGGYFRLWLTQEGLLTGHDSADANFVYFHANDTPLITDTANAFWTGMLPGAPVNVNTDTPPANDPLFDPVDTGVAVLDYPTAVAAVNGRLGGDPAALATTYAPELTLTRSVLFNYSVNVTPPPPKPPNVMTDVTDFTSNPITATAGSTSVPVNLGGLEQVILTIDPFVMEYTDGLSNANVGWGQLTPDSINQTFRLYNLVLDLEYRTPYLARVLTSNLASHIVRSLVQASSGNIVAGSLAQPTTKVIVLIASNTNIAGFTGLFHLDWLLTSYEADVSPPSGALVFELRQSQSTGAYIVRISYVSQTLDQLRNLTPLTLAAPPAIAPVFIPGCSIGNATFDCPLSKFVVIANQVIDPHSADLVH